MRAKYLVLFAILQLYAAHIKAQQNDYADRVYLYNGSRIVGKIIYYSPNDTVQVQVTSGQIIRFAPQQVQKIKMNDGNNVRSSSHVEKPYNFKEKGMYDALSFNLNFGRTSEPHLGYGVQNVVGYQFNRWVGGGVGIGYDSYYASHGESNVISLFGEYRGYLSKRNTSEYWTFAAGYGQPTKNSNDVLTNLKGSFMCQPTIGFRFGASSRYNFFTDFGLRVQRVHYENNSAWSENSYTVTYYRWILRGGILF
ncbi:MAG: hypothetical protein JNL70_12630 [Saprospiraceae bacterium]|nr:hypothetical protein [Saprospiraceae bacterium]